MTTITISSDHPDAHELVRRALENYALVATSIAVQSRTRPLHPKETRERLEVRAQVLDARAEALTAMAEQIPAVKPEPPPRGNSHAETDTDRPGAFTLAQGTLDAA